jgi:glycosyltransferase involved in cell wall biosynthesis
MKIAVVVPVKNEIDGLGELVTTLQKQVSAGDEIIFVDAGSADGTQEALREYAAHDPRIRLIVSRGSFPGKSRNIAIRATNADIIAQIDGGNHPEEHWLENLVAPICRGEVDYSMGNVAIMPVYRRFLGRIMDMGAVYGASLHRTEFRTGSTGTSGRGASGMPAGGASVAYRRWIWEKTGGFPEWLRYGEDPLFVRRVMRLQPRIGFAPDAILYWQLGPTLRHILRRQIHRAADLFHDPVTLRRGQRPLIARILLLILIAAASVLPRLWGPVALILGALLALQTAKSVKAYCRRVKPIPPDLLRALLIFPFIEGLALIARFVGTVQGILWLRNARAEWAARRRYLAGDLTA